MMESVAKSLQDKFGERRPLVVAVTVLTSLSSPALREIGVERSMEQQVEAMTRLAEDCGIGGVVCSPQEIGLVRRTVGREFKIVTPGIRMPGQPANDQQRMATPREAIDAGADYLVVGRAVTSSANPRTALDAVLVSLL